MAEARITRACCRCCSRRPRARVFIDIEFGFALPTRMTMRCSSRLLADWEGTPVYLASHFKPAAAPTASSR